MKLQNPILKFVNNQGEIVTIDVKNVSVEYGIWSPTDISQSQETNLLVNNNSIYSCQCNFERGQNEEFDSLKLGEIKEIIFSDGTITHDVKCVIRDKKNTKQGEKWNTFLKFTPIVDEVDHITINGGSSINKYLKSIKKDTTEGKITITDQDDNTTEFPYGGAGGSVAFEDITGRPRDNENLNVEFTDIDVKFAEHDILIDGLDEKTQEIENKIDEHTADTTIHVTTKDKEYWSSKADQNTLQEEIDQRTEDVLDLNTGLQKEVDDRIAADELKQDKATLDKDVHVCGYNKVVANPVAEATSTLTKIDINGEILSIEGGSPVKTSYASLRRLGDYIYEVTYDSLPEYDPSQDNVSILGGCSSFVRDGKLYRNLDWDYNNMAEFHIVFKDVEGMSFDTTMNDGQLSDKWVGQLPYHMCDGRNSHGLMVSAHALYNDFSYQGSGKQSESCLKLPFTILTTMTDINTISPEVQSLLDNMLIPSILSERQMLIQVLVTDGITTKVFEPTERGYTYTDITSLPKLTNFKWINKEIIENRNDPDLQDRPNGIERWNLIDSDVTLEELRFTLAYENNNRLSDFIGLNETTKESTDAELQEIYEIAHAAYLTRERDGTTWQTVHSVIYSPSKMQSLYVQENYVRDYISSSGSVVGDVYWGELPYSVLDSTRIITYLENNYFTQKEVDRKVNDVQSNLDTHAETTSIHTTSTEKTNWNNKLSHDDVRAGTGITIDWDRVLGRITINATGGSYVPISTLPEHVYIVDSNGIQSTKPYSSGTLSDSIVLRDMDGRFACASPVNSYEVTNKEYVDNGDWILGTNLWASGRTLNNSLSLTAPEYEPEYLSPINKIYEYQSSSQKYRARKLKMPLYLHDILIEGINAQYGSIIGDFHIFIISTKAEKYSRGYEILHDAQGVLPSYGQLRITEQGIAGHATYPMTFRSRNYEGSSGVIGTWNMEFIGTIFNKDNQRMEEVQVFLAQGEDQEHTIDPYYFIIPDSGIEAYDVVSELHVGD